MSQNQKTHNRCTRCGRILRDPVSLAMGMGPECRGGKGCTCRQAAHKSRLQRGAAYTDHAPILFHNTTYTFDAAAGDWVSSQSGKRVSNNGLKRWLQQNRLAIFPEEYLDTLRYRRALLVETLNDAAVRATTTGLQQAEMQDELLRIQAILDVEDSPELEPIVIRRRSNKGKGKSHGQ